MGGGAGYNGENMCITAWKMAVLLFLKNLNAVVITQEVLFMEYRVIWPTCGNTQGIF